MLNVNVQHPLSHLVQHEIMLCTVTFVNDIKICLAYRSLNRVCACFRWFLTAAVCAQNLETCLLLEDYEGETVKVIAGLFEHNLTNNVFVEANVRRVARWIPHAEFCDGSQVNYPGEVAVIHPGETKTCLSMLATDMLPNTNY